MIDLPIPPIVRDLINKLNSPAIDVHEKDNLVVTVEEIGRICTREAERFRKLRTENFAEDRRKRRKGKR